MEITGVLQVNCFRNENAINGPNAQEKEHNIFRFTDFGKRVKPKFVASAIGNISNPNVLEDLMPIARMYADMGYDKSEVQERLLAEFKDNYGESDHVIDFGAKAAFLNGTQYSKLALTKQFPDPDQRARIY